MAGKIKQLKDFANAVTTTKRWHNESGWLFAAALIAGIVGSSVILTALMALGSLKPVESIQKIDIIYKLGLIGAAAVTFCTVVWRGLISARQASAQLIATDLQRQQIEKLAEQISATEENNLAALLQKGAELIGEEKRSHIAAGVATLDAVATAKNPKFAGQAMNLLADFVQDNYHDLAHAKACDACVNSLAAASILDRSANRDLAFDGSAPSTLVRFPILGVSSVTIRGGDFYGEEVNRMIAIPTRYRFRNCKIVSAHLDTRHGMHGCKFLNCKIKGWHDSWDDELSFTACDFSGAVIEDSSEFPDLREHKNYFLPKQPPVTTNKTKLDWSHRLLVGKPDSIDDDLLL
jgi:hypothetical protein